MRHYLLLLLCSFICINLYAQAVLPKPDQYYSVVDKASLLKTDEFQLLSEKLDSFKSQTEHELVVVIIPGLGSLTIEEYANKLFNNWGIGQKEQNNGILLLIAIKDRTMRIESGYGIEDKVTDSESAYIIDNILKPNFKSGKFYEGLILASDFLISELSSNAGHKNYFDKTKSNSSTYNFKTPVPISRRDSIKPWIVLLSSFLFQLFIGLFFFRYLRMKKEESLSQAVLLTIVQSNIFYVIFSMSFYGISDVSKLSYSTVNIVFFAGALFCIALYGFYLLPLKTRKFMDFLGFQIVKLVVSALFSMFLSLFSFFIWDSFSAYFVVFCVITLALFILSFKFNLGNSASAFFKSGSGGGYSNNNSSSYNSTSYNNSYSGSSGSSYGGGSSGGGGASGSW